MKLWIFLVPLLAALNVTSSTSAAPPSCGEWSADALTLGAWEAASDERQNITVAFTLQSNLAAPTTMVEAQLRFYDALGRHVDTLSIEPNLKVPAGGAVTSEARTRTQRLLEVAPTDMVVLACTKSVLYEDGSRVDY